MVHSSYAYPSHLVMVLEAVLLALAVAVVCLAPARADRLGRGFARRLRRAARRPRLAALALGLLAALATASTFALLGPPIPRATDEHAYLLAADTFAHGRLANRSSPCWRHLDVHSLQTPVYAAKYPPGQGLLLAAGQAAWGHPAAALALVSGLLAAAAVWMLLAWVPPPWALVGGLVVLLRLAVGSYWQQSYWGGAVAALGGLALYGALRRLARRRRAGEAAIFALGLVVLANSRPFEGLLAALPASAAVAVLLAAWLRAGRRRAVFTVAATLLAVLLPAALAMAVYNARITGSPWRLPHRAYAAAYNAEPELLFQASYGRPFTVQGGAPGERASAPSRRPWLGRAAAALPARAGRALYFVLGLGLVPPLLLTAGALGRDRWSALAALACLLVLAGHAVSRVWFPHYSAPLVAPLLALAVIGLRRLWAWRWRGRPVGRALLPLLLAIDAVLLLLQLPAYRPDADDWSRRRQAVQEQLEALPGRHLVVVENGRDWVTNGADLDTAKVVWARDLGAAANRRLEGCFAERRHWRLEVRVDRDTPPRLVPLIGWAGEGS